MNKQDIITSAETYYNESPLNYVSAEIAMDPEYIGLKLFDPPIFAFGAADDEIYNEFKSPEIIGDQFRKPTDFLQGAKSVITFFIPYTERIRISNAQDYDWPSREWLHGRIEGQTFVKALCIHICDFLTHSGYKSLIPSFDKDFKVGSETNRDTSNWSERHIAYACGLGTFGLSKGIITEKGTCGRLGSIVTELELPSSGRPYKDAYEYCLKCGTCFPHCPVRAITEEGKDDVRCGKFLDAVTKKHAPWYGCAKCQVGVPCESAIP